MPEIGRCSAGSTPTAAWTAFSHVSVTSTATSFPLASVVEICGGASHAGSGSTAKAEALGAAGDGVAEGAGDEHATSPPIMTAIAMALIPFIGVSSRSPSIRRREHRPGFGYVKCGRALYCAHVDTPLRPVRARSAPTPLQPSVRIHTT